MPTTTEKTEAPAYTLADILTSTDYGLDVFDPKAVADLEIFDRKGKPYIHDPVSDKDRPAKPEEVVRQLFLRELTSVHGYPRERIAVERSVRMGRDTTKSADIIVYRDDDPEAAYLIVEVKKPREKDGLEQLKTYCNAEGHRWPCGRTGGARKSSTARSRTSTPKSPASPPRVRRSTTSSGSR